MIDCINRAKKNLTCPVSFVRTNLMANIDPRSSSKRAFEFLEKNKSIVQKAVVNQVT